MATFKYTTNSNDLTHGRNIAISRSINIIANEIEEKWQKVNFAARPYLDALKTVQKSIDRYFMDDAKSLVLYFLSNASTFRGEDAKRLKAELKAHVSDKPVSYTAK